MIKEYTREGLCPLNDDKYNIVRINDGTSVKVVGKGIGVLSDSMLPSKIEQRRIDLFLEGHPEMAR